MVMTTKREAVPEKWKGFGPDPRDPSTVLYVQPDDVVTPLRDVGNGNVEVGDPILARDLAKEAS